MKLRKDKWLSTPEITVAYTETVINILNNLLKAYEQNYSTEHELDLIIIKLLERYQYTEATLTAIIEAAKLAKTQQEYKIIIDKIKTL